MTTIRQGIEVQITLRISHRTHHDSRRNVAIRDQIDNSAKKIEELAQPTINPSHYHLFRCEICINTQYLCLYRNIPLERRLKTEPLAQIDATDPFIGNDFVGCPLHQDMPFMQYVGTIDNI